MTTKAEILEELVAVGAMNFLCDMTLAGLIGMHAKVLTPGVAVECVVSYPLLAKLIDKSIATTIDAIEVMIAFSALDKVAVAICSSEDGRGKTSSYGTVAVTVHIIGWGRLFPDGSKSFVVDGPNLVDATQGSIGLGAPWVVVGDKEPLEMSADTIFGTFSQTGLRFQ